MRLVEPVAGYSGQDTHLCVGQNDGEEHVRQKIRRGFVTAERGTSLFTEHTAHPCLDPGYDLAIDFPDTRIMLPLGNHHPRSEEHTSELQSLMRISYAVFCLKKKKKMKQRRKQNKHNTHI